jgi:TMEM214, C-terminal, caspase 4 activator
MSSQWELVGAKKAKSNGNQSVKLTKSEKKKFVENAPKAEDICEYKVRHTLLSLTFTFMY